MLPSLRKLFFVYLTLIEDTVSIHLSRRGGVKPTVKERKIHRKLVLCPFQTHTPGLMLPVWIILWI